jgi:hypothetical protein
VSASDDDDVHGRQNVLLLLFFGTVGGGLYFVGWLTRPSFLYDSPLVCAAIAGGACYPARFLVENRKWWIRLGEPSERTKARRERARARALAEAREAAARRRAAEADGVQVAGARHSTGRRRFSWVQLVRRVVGVPLVLGSLAVIPLGISAGLDDQRLARSGQIQQATVLSVDEDKWSKGHDLTVTVARPGDGAPVEVTGADELDPEPEVGDRIDVIVDPEDPTYVLAAAVDWDMHWHWYVLMVFLGLVLAGLSAMLLV